MKASRGDREIVECFVDDRQRLRAIAKRAGPEERDDVIQDAMVKVIAACRSGEVLKPGNLLSRAIKRVAIDRLRSRKNWRFAASSSETELLVDSTSDPERGLAGAQRLRRALATIEAMPARRRAVFLLHRVEDLTYSQIADRLDISIKAVEKHMSLALKQLMDADE